MIDYHWSRKPGEFVDKLTGKVTGWTGFNGSVREWYETLVEVTIDMLNAIERQGRAKAHDLSIEASPNVEVIFQSSVLYGAKIRSSFVLQPEVDGNLRDEVIFVDRRTGEVHGRIKVQGIESVPSIWEHFKRLFSGGCS